VAESQIEVLEKLRQPTHILKHWSSCTLSSAEELNPDSTQPFTKDSINHDSTDTQSQFQELPEHFHKIKLQLLKDKPSSIQELLL
jgi:hypothetical protein